MDEYVRKDVFEEILKRMEAQNAASEARTAAQIAEIRADVKVYREESRRESESLASDIQAIKDTIADMRHASTIRWAVFSALAATGGVILAFLPYWPAVKTALGV